MQPAIALLELDSIAIGVRAGDAMVKRAPVEVTYAGTVHPGKYLVLVGGDVASVEEAYAAGLAAGAGALVDRIFLPAVHPEVVRILRGMRGRLNGHAIGVVETRTAAATIGAADRGRKGAEVELVEIRLAEVEPGASGEVERRQGGGIDTVKANSGHSHGQTAGIAEGGQAARQLANLPRPLPAEPLPPPGKGSACGWPTGGVATAICWCRTGSSLTCLICSCRWGWICLGG